MSTPDPRPCPLNQQALGWALHALEPDEEMAVLLHLPRCLSCQSAVVNAEQVLSGLGASVQQFEPPATLRDALLVRAAATPQRPAMLRPRTSPEVVRPRSETPTPRHRTDAGEADEPRVSDSRTSRSWLSWRGRRLVAASLALAGVLTVGGLAVRTAQLEQQRGVDTAQAQSVTELLRQLDRPGATHALLANQDGSAVAAVLVADGQRQVFTVGLPANAADRDTYVLWGMDAAGAAQAIATFDVAPSERGLRTVGSAAETDRFTGYAISLEPGRTAPAEPSTVVASGQVEI